MQLPEHHSNPTTPAILADLPRQLPQVQDQLLAPESDVGTSSQLAMHVYIGNAYKTCASRPWQGTRNHKQQKKTKFKKFSSSFTRLYFKNDATEAVAAHTHLGYTPRLTVTQYNA
jgi:hypothetical protein